MATNLVVFKILFLILIAHTFSHFHTFTLAIGHRSSPLKIVALPTTSQQHQQQQQQPEFNGRRKLMIGQHYSNFSSIIPYSIEQDSPEDYLSASSSQEDPLVDVDDEEQREHQLQLNNHQQQRQLYQQQLQLQLQQQPSRVASDRAASTTSDEAKSRALLPLDSNRLILPQMQQIKSRFNQGCVGGTKCQFFAFCWMSGGSLGASCGLLMTCCVTPSRQEIQPGFYGPVVNDPCKYALASPLASLHMLVECINQHHSGRRRKTCTSDGFLQGNWKPSFSVAC